MHNLVLSLHVVAAVFIVGPLTALVNQTARALTRGDAAVLREQSRLVTIYGWSSLAVGVLGLGLVRRDWDVTFGEAWVLASLVLFMLASALVVGLLAPLLRRAVGAAGSGQPTRDLVGRAAGIGGTVSLLYLAITVLMVTQPGG
jgi:uncharacterized membrane protein